MKKFKRIFSLIIVSVMLIANFTVVGYAKDSDNNESGTLNVISYDLQSIRTSILESVFGVVNVTEIGSIINALGFEIVGVQEAFDVKWDDYPIGVEVPDYHDVFTSVMTNYADVLEEADEDDVIGGVIDSILGTEPAVVERHQTVTGGDGLSIYSKYPIFNSDRQKWNVCDNKLYDGTYRPYQTGFVVTTIELAEGYFLDIYNVSADEHVNSVSQRQAQFEQLANYIKKHSKYNSELGVYQHAVIVLGNLNASICTEESVYSNDGIVANLIINAGLNDAWAVSNIASINEGADSIEEYFNYALSTELTFDQAYGHYDSVERILYADGNGIDLSLNTFNYVDILGVLGDSLSDHKAAVAEISFEIVDKSFEYGNESNDKVLDEEDSWLIRFLNSIANVFKAIGYFFQNLFK